MKTSLAALLALALLTECHHKDPDPQKPEDLLPPATQTGARTFGCLVNGQAWVPEGKPLDNYSVILYEPSINSPSGAQFNIQVSRNTKRFEYINLFCGPIIPQKRLYAMSLGKFEAMGAYDGFYGDYSSVYNLTYLAGQVELTRVDEQAGVVAGTFWFTALRPGGDTLKVTQGRFDYKF